MPMKMLVLLVTLSIYSSNAQIKDRFETWVPSEAERREAFTQSMSSALCNSYPQVEGPPCHYKPPFKLVKSRKEENPDALVLFAPLEQVNADSATLGNIARSLSSWEPLECRDSRCFFARLGFDQYNKNVSAILLCGYTKLERGYAAPECDSIIVKDKDGGVWILALVGHTVPPAPGPPPPPPTDVKQFHAGVVGKLPSAAAVEKAVLETLTKPVLSLTMSNVPIQNLWVAGTPGRNSPILKPFREQSTVSIHMDRRPDGPDYPFIGFWIVVNLYVNRYNTDDPNDWHQASPQQYQMYDQAVRKALFERLQSLCERSLPLIIPGLYIAQCD